MKRLSMLSVVLMLCVVAVWSLNAFVTSAAPKATNWAQWRGPEGNGVFD